MNEKYPYKLLFIEDEEMIRRNYVAYLDRYFEHIYEAQDGKEAYRIYLDKKPDIMIIDINIPYINGLDLLQKIRLHDHTTRAIMLTAHQDSSYLLKATELKLSKYIIKPASRNDLRLAIEKAVDELENFRVQTKSIVLLKENHRWLSDTQELYCGSSSIALTNQERQLLSILFSDSNRVFTYDEIIISLWDDYENDKKDSLKTLVKNLRRKLPKESIKNVFGVGYQIAI